MKYTEDQWLALCKLRRIAGPLRQSTPTNQALREVLVDGVPPLEAAERHGLTHQCVYNAMSRSRDIVEVARVVAEAPQI